MKNDLEHKMNYEANSKPVLNLIDIENTAVHTPTEKEYDTLMQIYESGNKKWANGKKPTKINVWELLEEETCVSTEKDYDETANILFGEKKEYEKLNEKIISLQELCNIQNIKPETIKELNTWYDKNKPNRISRG